MSDQAIDGPLPVARATHEHNLEDRARERGHAYVRFRDGGTFKAVPLPPDASPLYIGRAAACAVRIEHDGHVSRRHARLIHGGGWWSIADAGSHNGTFIGRRPIPGEMILLDGASFRVGRTTLVLCVPSSQALLTTLDEPAAPRRLQPTATQRRILVELARSWLVGDDIPVVPSNAEIARALGYSVKTIAGAISELYAQAGLTRADGDQRARLISLAMRERTVTPHDL